MNRTGRRRARDLRRRTRSNVSHGQHTRSHRERRRTPAQGSWGHYRRAGGAEATPRGARLGSCRRASNDIGLAAVDLRAVVDSVERLQQALDTNAGNEVVAARAAELLVEIERAFTHIRAVIAGMSAADDYLTQTQIKSELLPRMTDLFAASRIGGGITDRLPFAADSLASCRCGRSPRTRRSSSSSTFVLSSTGTRSRSSSPIRLDCCSRVMGGARQTFDGGSLVANMSALLEAIGEPVRTRTLPRRVEEQLSGRFIPEADTAPGSPVDRQSHERRCDAAVSTPACRSFRFAPPRQARRTAAWR